MWSRHWTLPALKWCWKEFVYASREIYDNEGALKNLQYCSISMAEESSHFSLCPSFKVSGSISIEFIP